jgi:hypothetical protein
MSFERIVRPFQTKDVTPPQRISTPDDPTVANVTIKCGAVGETKTFNGSHSSQVTAYVKSQRRELARQTSIKRITNPEDASQYVDVEVVDRLKTAGVNGEETTFLYKNNDN